MEQFKPTKIDLSKINGGQRYNNGNGVQAESINKAIEASAWAQETAESVEGIGTNQPNNDNINEVGTPNVKIETLEDGTKRLVFYNLKGEKGEKGKDGEVTYDYLEEKVTPIKNQTEKNSNLIKGLYSGLIQKGVYKVAEDVKISETKQITGGSELDGLTVVDGSIATIDKIQGNTVKSENLINIPSQKFSGAQTHEEFYVDINGTFTISYDTNLTMGKNGALLLLTIDGASLYTGAANGISHIKQTFTGHLTGIVVVNYCEATGTATNFMLNYGETDLPYTPYFTDLKNAKISGIKSVGRNLINIPSQKFSGAQTHEEFYVDINGTFTISYDTNLTMGKNGALLLLTIDGASLYTGAANGISHIKQTFTGHLTGIVVVNYCEATGTATNFMLNYGETDLPYEPYIESVMTLPQTIELGKWDYIENGKIVRQTIIETFNSSKYSEENDTYNGTTDFVLSLNGTQVAYKGETPTITDFVYDNTYQVWDKGLEQIISTNNVIPIVENDYYILVGGAE